MEELCAESEVVVVFFGLETSEDQKLWNQLGSSFDGLTFAHVTDKEIFDEQAITDPKSIVIYKEFEPYRDDFEGEI